MKREERDQRVARLLDSLLRVEPVAVEQLEPGLPGVTKFTAQITGLAEKQVKPIVRYMKEKGWIAFEAINNAFYLVVTVKGKKHWKKQQIPPTLPKTRLKDARWLVVMFDIPNKHKTARDKFRKQLKEWGFANLMESTFVSPYDWRKEVENLRMLLGIAPYVRLLQVQSFERDVEFVRRFG